MVMAELKCVIGDVKAGRTYQRAVALDALTGRKIGETVPGSLFGLSGYELQITGGSDTAGFPMRKDLDGSLRKKIMLKKGDVGVRQKEKGVVIRKTVRGNTINNLTAQVNMKILKYGTKSVEELFGVEKKEEKKEEAIEHKEQKEEPKDAKGTKDTKVAKAAEHNK